MKRTYVDIKMQVLTRACKEINRHTHTLNPDRRCLGDALQCAADRFPQSQYIVTQQSCANTNAHTYTQITLMQSKKPGQALMRATTSFLHDIDPLLDS